MLATEWPLCGAAMTRWLEPRNFDAEGRQLARLEAIRRTAQGPTP
jgi:hypothetical protein